MLHSVLTSLIVVASSDWLIDSNLVSKTAIEAGADSAGWRAQPFKPADGLTASEFAHAFLGVAPTASMHDAPRGNTVRPLMDLPDQFDWRTANDTFADCVGPVVRQSPIDKNGTVHHCGSCWAVSAVETLSDRRCIAMRQAGAVSAPRIELSALDLIACDRKCEHFHKQCNMGCLGGFPLLAWEYFESTGVRSAACMPYNLTKQLLCPLIPCKAPLSDAKYTVRRHYKPFGVEQIKKDLVAGGPVQACAPRPSTYLPCVLCALVHPSCVNSFSDGGSDRPVQATFSVYEDFMSYAGGVYRHVSGRRLGLHAVKILGYGTTTNGSEYWTAMNSWGPEFGINGTFMIATGECGIDEAVLAGDPCLPGDPYPCHRV